MKKLITYILLFTPYFLLTSVSQGQVNESIPITNCGDALYKRQELYKTPATLDKLVFNIAALEQFPLLWGYDTLSSSQKIVKPVVYLNKEEHISNLKELRLVDVNEIISLNIIRIGAPCNRIIIKVMTLEKEKRGQEQ